MIDRPRLWIRRLAEAAALTAVASAFAFTVEWLTGERPHLLGVILPPCVIFLVMLASSPSRERARRERRKHRGEELPPERL